MASAFDGEVTDHLGDATAEWQNPAARPDVLSDTPTV
jgi:hypothetical protein